MRMLQEHPHVVQLHSVYEDNECFHLVMEYCEGGELFDRIIDQGHFSERDAAVIMRALLDFIKFAHSKHIVHRWGSPELPGTSAMEVHPGSSSPAVLRSGAASTEGVCHKSDVAACTGVIVPRTSLLTT